MPIGRPIALRSTCLHDPSVSHVRQSTRTLRLTRTGVYNNIYVTSSIACYGLIKAYIWDVLGRWQSANSKISPLFDALYVNTKFVNDPRWIMSRPEEAR